MQEWATRIQQLGCLAFKTLSADYEQLKVVDKFCDGLFNRRMGHDIRLHEPESLSQALRLAMVSETSFRNLVKREKPSFQRTRRAKVEFDDEFSQFDSDDDETESEEEYMVQQVSKQRPQFRKRSNVPRPSKRETPEKILLDVVNLIQRSMNVSAPNSNSTSSKSGVNPFRSSNTTSNLRSSSTQTSSENNSRQCFQCGDPTHFVRDCPERTELNQ